MEEIKLADFEGLATLQDDAHPRVSFFIEGSRIYKKTEIGSNSGLVDLELEQLPIKHFSRAELARTWGLTCLKTKRKFLEPQSATTSLSIADFLHTQPDLCFAENDNVLADVIESILAVLVV